MRLTFLSALLSGGVLAATSAQAALPTYTYQLQARANLRGNPSGAFNLEPGNLLPGSYRVPLTADRQLAFRLSITPEGQRAVWWGQDGVGQRIYLLPKELGEDVTAGDPELNAAGALAFAVSGGLRDNGVYLFNVQRPDQVRILKEPYGISSWSSLALNDAGQIAFRASFSSQGQAHVVLTPQGSDYVPRYLVREQGLDSASPFTYLYSPGFNERGQMAGAGDVAAPGAGSQELHIWTPGEASRRIAVTQALDATSPLFRIASVQPALSGTGQVAFLATVKTAAGANASALYLWDGTRLRLLAQDGVGEVQKLEIFPPDINDRGLVVFRAFDSAGLRAVWVSDGEVARRVVTEHDLVDTDLGPGRLDQEKTSVPVFGGSPTINARGDITFVAGVTPPDDDQVEWGTGIFVARAEWPAEPDAGTGEPDAGPGEPDAGEAPDAGELPDAGEAPDAGTGEPDAGEAPDAGPGPDAGTPGTPDAGGDEGGPIVVSPLPGGEVPEAGCGCQSAGPGALASWLLVGGAWLRARRRGRAHD